MFDVSCFRPFREQSFRFWGAVILLVLSADGVATGPPLTPHLLPCGAGAQMVVVRSRWLSEKLV